MGKRWLKEKKLRVCKLINLRSQLFACFSFTGMNFLGMLNHVCDVSMTKTSVDQSERTNVGTQIY